MTIQKHNIEQLRERLAVFSQVGASQDCLINIDDLHSMCDEIEQLRCALVMARMEGWNRARFQAASMVNEDRQILPGDIMNMQPPAEWSQV
jgi:hypothetical protein